MDNFVEALVNGVTPLAVQLVVILVGLVFGYIGKEAGKFFNKLSKREDVKLAKEVLNRNRELVQDAVEFVEQEAKRLDLHGFEKFELAKQTVVEHAREAGVNISEQDINVLIEKAVLSINQGFKEGMAVELSATPINDSLGMDGESERADVGMPEPGSEEGINE